MHGMKFAIIENEFGEVGVDDAIIKKNTKEEVIEMNNGCICCTVRGDLSNIVKDLVARTDVKFDGIIIETTGLADPSPVAQTFFLDETVAAVAQLDGIITVVDAKHVLFHLLEEKPDGVENEAVEQVAFADRILLNKTDLVDAATLANVKRELRKVNKGVDIVECQYSKVDPKSLIGIKAFDLDRCLEVDPDFLHDGDGEGHHHHDHGEDCTVCSKEEGKGHKNQQHKHKPHTHDAGVTSVGFKMQDCDLSLGKLQQFIRSLIIDMGEALYRYKGVISVKGMDKRFVFQGVHMMFDGDFTEPWEKNETRESRFIFIGKNLNKKGLEQGFLSCKAGELRFNVGDSVFANTDIGYRRGSVVNVWDEGNAYRVSLEDDTEVWAPIDDDTYIRADPAAYALDEAIATAGDYCDPQATGGKFLPERPAADSDVTRAWFAGQKDTISKFIDQVKAKAALQELKRVPLLKKLDEISGVAFQEFIDRSSHDQQKKDLIKRVVFESNFSGIEDGSAMFFEALRHKCLRQSICRSLIETSLSQSDGGGFSPFEATLISQCARISEAYDSYYMSWLKAVQDPIFVTAIKDEHDASKRNREKLGDAFLSPYTIIRARLAFGGFDFIVEPYSVFFENTLPPVLAAFDGAVAALKAVTSTDETHAEPMILYLQQYRSALAEDRVDKLEEAWSLCDRRWMDTKAGIQIVHDIEDGYSDPLRAKQGPDFSLRFLDETFDTQNSQIQDIHSLICKYYKSRKTSLSADGLTALSNTIAGIYYIPFKTGCSLVFSYSGQSIPNRLDVKKDKGVKIYFDAVETMARVEQVKSKVLDIFADARSSVIDKFQPDAVDQLVWHVAAHEVGHAIYGIRSISQFIQKETNMMLEEPRAELTAMFTLRLLHKEGVLSMSELQKHVVHFCLDGVRYFMKFNTISLQPYIVFQIHAYNTYFKENFLAFDSEGKILIDPTKVLNVLDSFSDLFEQILDALDLNNEEGGKTLENILEVMRQPSAETKTVIDLC